MALKRFCDWCNQQILVGQGRCLTNAPLEDDDGITVQRWDDRAEVIDLCDSCWSEARTALLDVKRECKVAV